jgi:hypothetical protein
VTMIENVGRRCRFGHAPFDLPLEADIFK